METSFLVSAYSAAGTTARKACLSEALDSGNLPPIELISAT